MPENGPSFIPKRTPTKRARVQSPRRVYVFSYIAYTLIFGAVVTAAIVFVYKLQVEATLAARAEELSRQVDSFSQADLETVKEFEQRLKFASERMQSHYSIADVLEKLDSITVASVQFKDLELVRQGDDLYELNGLVVTDSFNSTIFQRDLLRDQSVINSVFLEDVTLQVPQRSENELGQTQVDSGERVIEFKLLMELDPNEFKYQGVQSTAPVLVPQEPVTGTSTLEANETSV